MPLPSEWATRTVERIYIDTEGNPLSGTVSFIADVPVETTDESIVILPRSISAELDETGKLSIVVPVTDDTDMRNYNFTYRVTEALTYSGGGSYSNTYNVQIPSGVEPDPGDWNPLQLGAQAPVPAGAGLVVVDGLQGKSAYEVAVGNGFVGTESEWLASLVSTVPGPDGDTGDAGPSVYDLWLADNPGGTFADFLLTLKGAPGDVSGLAAVASSGLATDLNTTGWNYAMLVGERQTQGILPDKVVIAVDYNEGTSTWDPTPSTRLRRLFQSPVTADPAALSQENDIWLVES